MHVNKHNLFMNNTLLMERRFSEAHRGRAGHINIQHYAQLAAEATDSARQDLAQGAAENLVLKEERFRFEAEMHAGDLACVSGHFDQASAGGLLAFEGTVTRGHEGPRCCRFIRIWVEVATGGDAVSTSDDELPIPGISAMYTGQSFDSFDGVLGDPAEVSKAPQALWHVMTEALWHVQHSIGTDVQSQRDRSITGGASLFQLFHHNALVPGTPVTVVTTLIGHGTSSLRFEHRISDANTKNPLVTARYVLAYQQNGERFPVVELVDPAHLGSRAS